MINALAMAASPALLVWLLAAGTAVPDPTAAPAAPAVAPAVAETPKATQAEAASVAWVRVVPHGEAPVKAALDAAIVPAANIALGDELLIKVDNLKLLTAATSSLNPLALFIDGRELKGLETLLEPGFSDLVRVRLERTGSDENKRVWRALLGRPTSMSWDAELTVGSQDRRAAARPIRVRLGLAQGAGTYFFLAFVLLLVVGLFAIAARTTLLRDPGPAPQGALPTYSLSRTQMAAWFGVVLVSFLFIWALTGATDSLTGSVLTLMGLGSGTALGAALVDSRRRTILATDYAALERDERRLVADIEERTQKRARVAADADRVQEAEAKAALQKSALQLSEQLKADSDKLAAVRDQMWKTRPGAEASPSQGFVRDLLTDDTGYSLHRLQMAGWTLVLIVVFLHSVYAGLSMPEFDATLLALMGISGGTYLGFKLPEKQTPDAPTPVTPVPATTTAAPPSTATTAAPPRG